MIQNDEQFTIVKQQLDRAEAALRAIRRDVFPKSAERFRLMAEAYVDQIEQLRAEIDDYLGIRYVRRHSA